MKVENFEIDLINNKALIKFRMPDWYNRETKSLHLPEAWEVLEEFDMIPDIMDELQTKKVMEDINALLAKIKNGDKDARYWAHVMFSNQKFLRYVGKSIITHITSYTPIHYLGHIMYGSWLRYWDRDLKGSMVQESDWLEYKYFSLDRLKEGAKMWSKLRYRSDAITEEEEQDRIDNALKLAVDVDRLLYRKCTRK